jgi:hypothetical protein
MHLARHYDARPAAVTVVQMRATENVFYTDHYAREGLGWRSRALVATLAARVREVGDRQIARVDTVRSA